MSGLVVEGLTVRFGATVAVDDCSLAVAEGSVFGLVGPSGCGKSTLLRAVAGLVSPSAGRIWWNDDDITDLPTHRRDIGLMFQHHALFTHRSVAENVEFGLKMAGMAATDRRARVDALLAMVGLSGFGGRPIEGLSGGEAQRVALARALAPEPRLLLLDEPLASLDRARRIELNAELSRLLHELGQTAVYVTHDQEEAFAVADEIGVMFAGSLLRVGTPAQVWRDPQSELVARFVGHDTIIERDGRRFAVRADAVRVVLPGGDDGDVAADFTGTIRDCTFQGDRYEVTVDVDGVPWRAFTADPVPLGTTVGLALDADRLATLM